MPNFFALVRESLERRAVMRELRQLEEGAETGILSSESNPVSMAVRALAANNLTLAARCWDDACIRLPDHVLKSKDSIGILLGLDRLDELERLMNRGMKEVRHQRYYIIGLALVYERRKDLDQAHKYWSALRRKYPSDPLAYTKSAACLCSMNRPQDAVALLKSAAQYFSQDNEFWVGFAAATELAGDQVQSLRHWDYVAYELHNYQGYLGAARVCEAMGYLDDAMRRLRDGHGRHPADGEITIALAKLAERMGDLREAARVWNLVRLTFPIWEVAYREEAKCLAQIGDRQHADAVILEAIQRFPDKFSSDEPYKS